MEKKDACFCKESFIDGSFLVLEILHKPRKPMVNRVKNNVCQLSSGIKNIHRTKLTNKIHTGDWRKDFFQLLHLKVFVWLLFRQNKKTFT